VVNAVPLMIVQAVVVAVALLTVVRDLNKVFDD